MLKNILVIFSLVAAAYGSGQLSILECPDQIKPPKTGKLDGKLIGQVFRACTGHSITESVPLKMELPPFDLAEQVCLINIEGVSDFTSKTLKPKSEIEIYGPENNFETFTNKLYEESASMVTLNLNDGLEALSSLQDWCETSLKPERAEVLKALRDEKNAEAKQFVEAIAVMSVLSQATCKMPEFLQIDLNLNDAKSRDKYMELFVDTVKAFSKRYSENTNGNGMVAVLSSDEKPLKRSRRAVADDPNSDLNLAESYSEDYPVIFNIILWFGVLIVFSMLAISYAIAGMDPGRDSIIYRMTSTRIKKDN